MRNVDKLGHNEIFQIEMSAPENSAQQPKAEGRVNVGGSFGIQACVYVGPFSTKGFFLPQFSRTAKKGDTRNTQSDRESERDRVREREREMTGMERDSRRQTT